MIELGDTQGFALIMIKNKQFNVQYNIKDLSRSELKEMIAHLEIMKVNAVNKFFNTEK